MKLMLTSSGLSNNSLKNALRELVTGQIKIAFIPTAANMSKEDKGWLIQDLVNCKDVGAVDIVDISALKKEEWLPRLEWANVIFVGGGDTAYLAEWIIKSGLDKEFPRLLEKRVYVGISAGSIVASKSIQASSDYLYGDEVKNPPAGLGLVSFYVRPHLNNKSFPKVNEEHLGELASKFDGDLYGLDDCSGIVFNDGKIEVVSEGKWIKYPN